MTGGAAAAAGFTSAFLFPQRALAQQKTLKILQWSHFVPGYDKWFDNTFTKEWGAKHNTNVIVDHIAIAEINARAAAEVSAKKGHDLVMFLSPPAAYEKQVLDHRDVYAEVEKKHGKKIGIAEKSTLNPKTKKYFAFSDSFVPDPGNYRVDLWSQMVTMVEIASMASAVCIITTIFTQRAPGMSLNRIPLFVWAQLVIAFMIGFKIF